MPSLDIENICLKGKYVTINNEIENQGSTKITALRHCAHFRNQFCQKHGIFREILLNIHSSEGRLLCKRSLPQRCWPRGLNVASLTSVM
jgi:hypothetical protein